MYSGILHLNYLQITLRQSITERQYTDWKTTTKPLYNSTYCLSQNAKKKTPTQSRSQFPFHLILRVTYLVLFHLLWCYIAVRTVQRCAVGITRPLGLQTSDTSKGHHSHGDTSGTAGKRCRPWWRISVLSGCWHIWPQPDKPLQYDMHVKQVN